jgi:hypothetical protein
MVANKAHDTSILSLMPKFFAPHILLEIILLEIIVSYYGTW